MPKVFLDSNFISPTFNVEDAITRWSAVKNFNDEASLILALQICQVLERERNFSRLGTYLNALPQKDIFMKNEHIIRAKISVAFQREDYPLVCDLIRNNHFSSAGDLIEIWDKAHYAQEMHRTKKPLTPLSRFRIRQRCLPPESICPGRKRAKNVFSKRSRDILQRWLDENKGYPYPSKETKKYLSKMANITTQQVQTWFANARRRVSSMRQLQLKRSCCTRNKKTLTESKVCCQSDDAKTDDAETGDTKTDDTKTDDVKTDDTKTDDAKTDDAKLNDAKLDDARAEDSKSTDEMKKPELSVPEQNPQNLFLVLEKKKWHCLHCPYGEQGKDGLEKSNFVSYQSPDEISAAEGRSTHNHTLLINELGFKESTKCHRPPLELVEPQISLNPNVYSTQCLPHLPEVSVSRRPLCIPSSSVYCGDNLFSNGSYSGYNYHEFPQLTPCCPCSSLRASSSSISQAPEESRVYNLDALLNIDKQDEDSLRQGQNGMIVAPCESPGQLMRFHAASALLDLSHNLPTQPLGLRL